jgi:hypothetical protein
LEAVIDRIPDKKLQRRLRRMPWTNYAAIINALGDESVITNTAREASLRLNAAFMKYRRHKSEVSDQAIGAMEIYDRQLEVELKPRVPEEKQKSAQTRSVDEHTAAPA